MNKLRTGIPGLDDLLGGGIPAGSTTLLSGRSGSGKTIFGMQYLYNGASQHDEPGILVTLEARPNDLRAEALQFGWNLSDLEKSGKLTIIDAASSKAGLPTSEKFALKRGFDMEALAETIYNAIEETKAKRLVLDSISGLTLRFSEPSEVRRELYRISALLNELNITSLFIGEIDDSSTQSRAGVEQFIAQGLITLNLRENDGGLDRDLLIWKMRLTSHSMKKHPYVIDDKGIQVKKTQTKKKNS
ncbi:MAG: ATPase domain-containing protein [Candidatus Thorarchaeota archaeon]|nr:ATPase domain-containing protein [Candidatus Thorarchaeota archaeon]